MTNKTRPSICPSCGGPATESIQIQYFEDESQQPVRGLEASLPVIACAKCETEFTDWRGEAIREAVIMYNRAAQLPQLIDD